METRANYLMVGGFVLAVLAALVLFLLWLTRTGDDGRPYYTYFSGSVTGLNVGSPVRYRGVPIGTVTEIKINQENVEQIRVTMKVQNDAPIQIDSVASQESQGITGGSYVQIKGGRQGSPRLVSRNGEIPVIPSEPGLLGSLSDQAPMLLQNLVTLSERANTFLSPENSKAMADILADVKRVTGQLTEVAPDIARSTKNIDQLTADLRTQIPKMTASLDRSLREFEGVGTEVRGLVKENREPIRDFSRNGLVQLSGTITELRSLIENLDRVVEKLDRSPQEFLFGGTNRGVDPRAGSQGVPVR